MGEDGLFSNAKHAKEEYEKAQTNEEIALNELYMQIEANGVDVPDKSNMIIFATTDIVNSGRNSIDYKNKKTRTNVFFYYIN